MRSVMIRGGTAAAVVASLLTACGVTLGPTPRATGIIHLENRMANTVVVGTRLIMVTRPDPPSATSDPATEVIPPCGGRLDVAAPTAVEGHASGAFIVLTIDPTGQLDRDLAEAGDVRKLTGSYQQMSIIWSGGGLATPLWVSIGPDAVVTSPSAPSTMPSDPCLPWSQKG